MKPALTVLCALMLSAAANAQAPTAPPLQQNPTESQGPVPIGQEPHHRLVLQNDFTHVYNVMVPPLDATLLHKHDFPYLYVVLGPTDIINAIVGKPELHQTLQDGETHFTQGNFAHIVRTDSGMPFHNITIELIHPQGTAKNACKEVLAGQPLDCPQPQPAPDTAKAIAKGSSKKKRPAPESADDSVPYFETDEVRVELFKASSGRDYVDSAPKTRALLVALADANLDVNLGGEHLQFVHGGDVLWLPAGQHRRVVDFLGTRSSFLLISFKDSAAAPVTQ
jgi:hypothetical protein